jgi:hypothetical protein
VKRPSAKCYIFDERLEAYFRERIALLEGPKPGEDEKKYNQRIQSSNTRKNRILNEVVFPSMANVVYFLEQVASNDELRRSFDPDIKDLFGMRFPEGYTRRDFEFDPHSTKDYYTVFERLLLPLLRWDLDSSAGFRSLMMHVAMQIILFQLQYFTKTQLTSSVRGILGNDLNRASAWIELISNTEELDYSEPNRPILF